jgi:pullulanase-type alpha-1,6-glucosidase
MTHLKALAKAGVTTVHILPAFDFAGVPQVRADQVQPPCDLSSYPPDSDQQQACIAQTQSTDGYNWGYNPVHYTVPEGAYATGSDGAERTIEFRDMVAALHKAGLRVVMDVVYNHTAASGENPNSVLDQIVPGYYQRLDATGAVTADSCCADTAPENAMMNKLIVDSVTTWAKQYHVDGFRFDLMGLDPKSTMLDVKASLATLTVHHDGIDGNAELLYGEGWNYGVVANNARFVQATQANMAGTGIATFNDRLRDAVRGGGPSDADPRAQGFASGLYTNPNGDPINGTAPQQKTTLLHDTDLVELGLTGNLADYSFTDTEGSFVSGTQIDYNGSPAGYTAAPGEAITYVDAHDNLDLYDALAYKLPTTTTPTDRARIQALALATSTLAEGPGFALAGSDLLRSKSLDGNSFDSGDWFNAIHWNCAAGNGFGNGLPLASANQAQWSYAQPLLANRALIATCAATQSTTDQFQQLLTLKASSPLFSLTTAADVQRRLSFPLSGTPGQTPGVITEHLDGHGLPGNTSLTVVFNATASAQTQTLTTLAGTDQKLDPIQQNGADPLVKQASFNTSTGTFTIPAYTVAVFMQRH